MADDGVVQGGRNGIDPEGVRKALESAPATRTVERLGRLFQAFGDPTRLRILHALTVADELCVCDLSAVAELSVSAVSHQLRLLRDRDLVQARRDGRIVYYRLADDHVAEMMRAGLHHTTEGD